MCTCLHVNVLHFINKKYWMYIWRIWIWQTPFLSCRVFKSAVRWWLMDLFACLSHNKLSMNLSVSILSVLIGFAFAFLCGQEVFACSVCHRGSLTDDDCFSLSDRKHPVHQEPCEAAFNDLNTCWNSKNHWWGNQLVQKSAFGCRCPGACMFFICAKMINKWKHVIRWHVWN